MPLLPHSYIVYRDGDQIVAQNSQTNIPEFQGEDAASVLLDAFAEYGSILVKAGEYDITAPLDLPSGISLAFEPGVTLWVPNGYDQHVIGLGDAVHHVRLSGGFVRESGDPQRAWQGVRMHESAGDLGIRNNIIERIDIWDADIAIQLLIEDSQGWINGNVFRDIFMYRSNVFIDFDAQEEVPARINRNLFVNLIGQMSGTTANTEVGARNVRDRANVFIDVKFWDFHHNNEASTATIHALAEDTMVLGGIMTYQNFQDNGRATQIIDPFSERQLFLNRLHIDGGDITVDDDQGQGVFHMDASAGHLRVGTEGNEGDITVEDGQGRRVFHMDSRNAHLRVGTTGNEGDVTVDDSQGRRVFHFDSRFAVLRLGAIGSDGDLQVLDDNGDVTIHLDGQTGMVEAAGADCAENFDVADATEVEPGTVMVFAPDGRICSSTRSYDVKVAGVVSGAGDYRPGLILGRRGSNPTNCVPLGLAGKLFCKVDATDAPIEAGDLLTTSSTPGHAMKAKDLDRASGAIIGKALCPLADGRKLVPILVTLQ